MDELYYQGTHSGPEIDALLDTVDAGVTPIVGKGINLLDNADFRNPVNQRGQSSYTNVGGTIDRWKIGTAAATLTVNSGYLTFATTSNRAEFLQVISYKFAELAGTKVSLSVLFNNGTLVTGVGSIPSTAPSTTTRFLQLSLPNSGGDLFFGYSAASQSLYLSFYPNSNKSISLVKVQLELGNTQTLARQENGAWVLNDPPPDYGTELAKCQRYLYVFNQVGSVYGNVGTGIGFNASQVEILCSLPMQLRKASGVPTITTQGGWQLADGIAGGQRLSVSSISLGDLGGFEGSHIPIVINATGITVGKTYLLRAANDASARLILSSEL